MVEAREHFRRVLPVAVEQDDDVETLFQEVTIACLLISAVTEPGVLQHLKLGKIAYRLVADSQLESGILAGIVENHRLLDVVPHIGRDALENVRQGGNRIVGNNQNTDPLSLAVGQRGVVREAKRR